MEPEPLHRKRNKKYNLEGHAHLLTFSTYQRMPLLTNDLFRTWLAQAIRTACEKHNVALWAYVFMPEHVHLLLKPRRAVYNLALFEQALKLSAAKRVINHLTELRAPLLSHLVVGENRSPPCYRFWQAGGGHDLNLWTLPKVVEKARYCHTNPVKRRLVRSPELWRWSSVRWLELGVRKDEPLVVDDWDERLVDEAPAPGSPEDRNS